MQSAIFNHTNNEVQTLESLALQNPYMVRARIVQGQEIIALKGSMVAYQGDVDFKHEGSRDGIEFLKKLASSDNMPLMRMKGDGDVFLARSASLLHILDLENDGITINGFNVVAFDAALKYELTRVKGLGMLTGGMWNTQLSGVGKVAISTVGQPVILECSQQPTYVDLQAAIAWSSNLTPSIKSSFKAGALIGRGSGESFQYAFHGQGWVIVQPSEAAPVTTAAT